MKKLIFISIIILTGCSQQQPSCRHLPRYIVYTSNGVWESENTSLTCDSVEMIGTKKAIIWNDGHKATIEAKEYIEVSTY